MSKKPKTQQEMTKEFIEKYQALCEEYQLQIVVNPAFKAGDDGTWSLVLQTSIGRLKEQKN